MGALTALLARGAAVNACDHTGQTALHWSAVRGALSAADVLLKSGASVAKADLRGYTAAHVAAQYGHTTLMCAGGMPLASTHPL